MREAADQLAEMGSLGGFRSRHRAADQAERLTDTILAAIPREYRGSVPPEVDDPYDDLDPTGLADAIQRQRSYP